MFIKKGGVSMLGIFKKNTTDDKDKVQKAKEIEILERMAAVPFPQSGVPSCSEVSKLSVYYEISKSIGFEPSELTRLRLIAFFEEKKICLYDIKQVNRWLIKKRKEANVTGWCWRPLREKDVIIKFRWGWGDNDGYYSHKVWECRPYERLVPSHALDKTKLIEDKFGGLVKFFVSDYVDPKVDPFIMVRPTMSNSGTDDDYMFVFDVWNEPGFGV